MRKALDIFSFFVIIPKIKKVYMPIIVNKDKEE